MNRLRIAVAVLAVAILAVVVGCAVTGPQAKAQSRTTHHYWRGRCEYNDSHAQLLCVTRAPRDVCRAALHVDTCWWFTGSDSQVVFDWKGSAVTS